MKQPLPLISVIVPVYNVERYLNKCVDSLIHQSYPNLEIILINDGSNDKSGQICDEYAAKDPRILVIHKENQGVSKARNDGIALAHGEYIMFVDSDDWVDPRLCDVLIDAISRFSVQSAMCSYIREYPEKSLPKHLHFDSIVFAGWEVQRRLCGLLGEEIRHPENLDCFNMMCAKLYPAQIVKLHDVPDIRELGSSEDMLFNLKIFTDIKSMVYLDQPLYHYRKSVTQSITAVYKPDLEEKWENLYCLVERIIQENDMDDDCQQAFNNRVALNMLGIGINCIKDNARFRVKYKRLKEAIARERRVQALQKLPMKHMPFYWKLFYFSAKYRLNLMLYLLLIVIRKLKGRV